MGIFLEKGENGGIELRKRNKLKNFFLKMSQLEVEEESLYNEPLDPKKRKLVEIVEDSDEKEAKKAKVKEEDEEIDVENESQVPVVSEDQGEQVVPEIIESFENHEDELQDEINDGPTTVSRFVGDFQVNPDPFQLIEQIRDEDFSDSESDSPPIFYDSDSSELEELDYFEVSTIWFEFNSSDIDNED